LGHTRRHWPDRYEVRVWTAAMWSLYGPYRRRGGSLVRNARIECGSEEGHDHRRTFACLEPSVARRLDRRAGASVRVLSIGSIDVGCGAAREETETNRRGN